MGRVAAIAITWVMMGLSGAWISSQSPLKRIEHDTKTGPEQKLTVTDARTFVSQTFMEIRRTLAILSWAEAQTYFHKGYDLTAFSRNVRAEEKVLRREAAGEIIDEHDHHDHDSMEAHEDSVHDDGSSPGTSSPSSQKEKHEPGGSAFHNASDQLKIKSLTSHPFLRRSSMRPYVFRHVESREGAQRMLPFYWLTARLDPNFTRAYTGAGYWLSFSFGRGEEGWAFLEEGLAANPTAYDIHQMMGHIAYSLRKDYRVAERHSRRAFELNPLTTIEQLEDAAESIRYLCHSLLAQGKTVECISTAYTAWRFLPDEPGIGAIISDATIALEDRASSSSLQTTEIP